MKQTEHNYLVHKAKTKKDGVYSYSPYMYAVKNKKFIAFTDYSGRLYRVYGSFNTEIGKCEICDRRKVLKQFI